MSASLYGHIVECDECGGAIDYVQMTSHDDGYDVTCDSCERKGHYCTHCEQYVEPESYGCPVCRQQSRLEGWCAACRVDHAPGGLCPSCEAPAVQEAAE